MKLTPMQIDLLVKKVFDRLKEQDLIIFKEKEEKVFKRAVDVVKKNIQDELNLEVEVNKMLDELEQKNPGEFQRYKMFTLVKKELAKKKGFIL